MINDVKIVPMNETHLKDLALLEKQCFSVPWSENALRMELTKDNSRFFVAVIKNEVLGYIGANNVLGEVYIDNIAVFSNFRGLGVATTLLNHLISVSKEEKCDLVTLEVRESNTIARKLYEKLGFKNVGVRKNFYDQPKEDGIIYTKFLGANK